MTLDEFLRWGAKYKDFPYSTILYWIDAAKRNDDKDMYQTTMGKK